MESAISEHCTAILKQKQTISTAHLRSLFDLIVLELNKIDTPIIDDYIQIIDTLTNVCSAILIDQSIAHHELFHLIRNLLTKILIQWSSDIMLTDQEEYLFQEIVDLYFKLIQHLRATSHHVALSIFQTWFLNDAFFKAIAGVLENISQNSSKYHNQDKNMKSLIILIQAIQCLQRGLDHIRNNPAVLLLIDPLVDCLSSSTYIHTLKNLTIQSNHRSSFEEFILGTCPSYCAWHRGQSQLQMIEQLCLKGMLKSYQEIYEFFLPTIDAWEYAVMESIFYMTALIRYVAYYPSAREYFKENFTILDSIFIILNNQNLLDNILITTDYNSPTNLTDSAISLVFNLTHDFQFLTLIKENNYFSKDIFLKLKEAKVDRVKLHAFMILAKLFNEHDIQKLDRIDTLISVFINYLYQAVNDPCHSFQDVPVEHLLVSFKGSTVLV